MGLDMYFNRTVKVRDVDELNEIQERLDKSENLPQTLNNIREEKKFIYDIPVYFDKWNNKPQIRFKVIYYRKFNALHDWIVQNCQEGIDGCQLTLVSIEKVKELVALLESLTPNNCEDLFPTANGFFFGGTDYDEGYWSDIKGSINDFNYLLNQFNWSECSLIYQSSW